ncbi:hypothetical protein, partial [Actinacidiphila oryziradicis]|uniref:hypothetical protein n=1 Tax=Actinacidiphila oryziradicis TaxID=2571141 RepID=UPI001B80DDBD
MGCLTPAALMAAGASLGTKSVQVIGERCCPCCSSWFGCSYQAIATRPGRRQRQVGVLGLAEEVRLRSALDYVPPDEYQQAFW